MKKLFVILFVMFSISMYSQSIERSEYPYRQYFQEAYQLHPSVPKGVLEAIAWSQTHIDHKTLANTSESCSGMPFGWGSFALVEDGKNWFRNNLITVSQLSGYTVDQIKNDERIHILAYAAAFEAKKNELGIFSQKIDEMVPVIVALSELHLDENNSSTDFAVNSFLYSVLVFLNNADNQDRYEMPGYNISLKKVFGTNNLNVLSSQKIQMSEHGIFTDDGVQYVLNTKVACPDYNVPHCSWVASPNYSSRAGTAISVVVMHTVQGSYSGCISWFQNPSAQASTSYVVRSSDGQLTQMVLEADKAWHVGSENPYSVGYEHEGYVEETGWYTVAMYQSSADLTRNICQAYGINPERMFFRDTLDSGTALDYGIHTLAGSTYCTKIAAHQHLPNQTHTDPGPNWYWDYYFKLVNNNPTVTTLSTATGTFYDTGGASAVYSDDERKVWTIQPAGATSVTLAFSAFSLEANYDFMYIYDGPTIWSPKIGRFNTTSPGTITSTGGALTIEFRSDCATTADGWVANWTSSSTSNVPVNLTSVPLGCPSNNVQFSWQNAGTGWYIQVSSSASFTNPYIKWVSGLTTYTGPSGFVLQSDGVTPLTFASSTTYYWRIWNTSVFTDGPSFTTLNCDNVAPTTSVSSPNTWKTADFTATFTDNDNTAIEKAFYQVLDYDGTYWGANNANGFFGDNFDIQQPVWTNALGTWNVTAGELIQSNEAENNSNFYAPLNQNLSNRYLYHFIAKVEGAGTNRRFGFHLFCDDGSQTNRGNSYFVWFRVEGQTLEFFKVTSNTFGAASKIITNVTTTAGQYYDFKITYDRILGTIAVWRDDVFMGSWTDPSPHTTAGNYISFRSGNSKLTVNELKVYRSRLTGLTVSLGDNTKDIRYQNPNPSTIGAKIKSIVVDSNYNLSTIAFHDLNVDWTPPADVSVIDGSPTDVDTVYSITTATGTWTGSVDPNSDVSEYWYALGSTSGGNDVVDWTNNGTNTTVTLNSLNLTLGNYYYFSVKVKNGADLWSNIISSDGFIVSSLALPDANFYVYEDTLYLPTANALFFNTSVNATSYSWDFGDGGTSTAINPWHTYNQVGVYNVKLIAMSPGFSNDTLIRNNYVVVLNQSSLEENLKLNTVIYPNPFSDEIKMEFHRLYTGTISLVDASGRVIRKTELENATLYTLTNLNEIEKGLYILEFSEAAKEIRQIKMVKK